MPPSNSLRLLLFLASIFFSTVHSEESIPPPLAEKGTLLFSDDFEREDLGEWKVVIPGFEVRNGILVSTQDREDHGAVGRVYLPMKDVILSFRFRMAGSPSFNVVFDDKNHKGSHAGHICRVAVTPRQIRLGDDKEGIMRNDIFAMRRDPATKDAADKLLDGRGKTVKAEVAGNAWHTMAIEIAGDRMRVSLDGKALGVLQSPGIAHPTKESVHFTVNGREMHFDEVRIWEAAP